MFAKFEAEKISSTEFQGILKEQKQNLVVAKLITATPVKKKRVFMFAKTGCEESKLDGMPKNPERTKAIF